MNHGDLLETWVRNAVCRISPISNKGLEIPIIEPDLIKKPGVEEDAELSDDKISDEFVPVEDQQETSTVEVSEPNNDK